MEGERIVSDENREKNLNENGVNETPQPAPESADVEDLLNEIRKQQNFTPKTPQVQETAGKTQEQPANNEPGAPQQAEVPAPAGEVQQAGENPQFEEISSMSSPDIQEKSTLFIPKAEIKPGEQKPKKKKTARYVVMGVLGVVILLAASFFGILFFHPEVIPSIAPVTEVKGTQAQAKDPVFAKGVQVGGIDVSGKTLKEATALIVVKEKDTAPSFEVDVVNGDMTLTYTQDDFGYTYNTKEVIAQAYQYSKDIANAMQDGSIDRLSKPEGDNVVMDEKNGTINFTIQCKVTGQSIDKIIKRTAKKMDIAAVEPHVSKFNPSASYAKMFTFAEGEDGVSIDRDKLKEDLSALFTKGVQSGSVTVQTKAAKPKHTMDQVKAATKLIGKFTTVTTNTYNANHNMEVALKAINGKIVAPGKNFSFNECTGDSNLASNGYLPASVIENGSYQQGYGGGICQAATTIYNAGIQANMGIVERYPHLWSSPYVYGGLDATIDYGNLDLKLKNNSEYQVFFKTYMEGTTLYCEIYGWQDPGFDEVRTESHNTWVEGEEFGFATQRVFYKNGKEVSREDLPDSTYSLSNGHYVVAGDPGKESRKLKQPAGADSKPDDNKDVSAKPTASSSQKPERKPASSSSAVQSSEKPVSSKPDKPVSSSQAPSSSSAPESNTTQAPSDGE